MPKLYVLVGVPGSGKSTWINDQDWVDACAVIGTDRHVEAYAQKQGRTYSDVFEEYMPTAVDLMAKDVLAARALEQDVIWDQTSTSRASRYKKFVMLPHYYKIAVVFATPNAEELQRRLASRPGKIIPDHVVQNMINQFEQPSVMEGFDQVWHAG